MNLLPEDKLIWSPIVVNSRMNRERNASGINSYEQEFKFTPEEYLEKRIISTAHASWLDLCCGQGKALIQTADHFIKKDLQHCIQLKGIDLVNTFPASHKQISCLQLETRSLTGWQPEQTYDLITCVHGLHYLGDKLNILTTAIKALSPEGLFIANLDLNNIRVNGIPNTKLLQSLFKERSISYNARLKVLKKTGPSITEFGLVYLGADDQHGPNYTGQDSVTSYYDTSRSAYHSFLK